MKATRPKPRRLEVTEAGFKPRCAVFSGGQAVLGNRSSRTSWEAAAGGWQMWREVVVVVGGNRQSRRPSLRLGVRSRPRAPASVPYNVVSFPNQPVSPRPLSMLDPRAQQDTQHLSASCVGTAEDGGLLRTVGWTQAGPTEGRGLPQAPGFTTRMWQGPGVGAPSHPLGPGEYVSVCSLQVTQGENTRQRRALTSLYGETAPPQGWG